MLARAILHIKMLHASGESNKATLLMESCRLGDWLFRRSMSFVLLMTLLLSAIVILRKV
jgi:hypothetical protein